MKSAQRLAYYLISRPEEEVQAFADAMVHAKKAIHYCSCCQNLTDQAVCPICSDDTRDHGIICVVEAPKDVAAFERTNEYHGVYHVLHGLISPLTGVMPEQLKIRELLARFEKSLWQPIPLWRAMPQQCISHSCSSQCRSKFPVWHLDCRSAAWWNMPMKSRFIRHWKTEAKCNKKHPCQAAGVFSFGKGGCCL